MQAPGLRLRGSVGQANDVVQKPDDCPACHGSGECQECEGQEPDCEFCAGTAECWECDGSGEAQPC